MGEELFGSSGGALALLLGFFATYALVVLLIIAYAIIVNWRIFQKAGEEGWKSIIPIYNSYIQFKIAGVTKYFWYTLILGFVSAIPVLGIFAGIAVFVLSILYNIKLAEKFGKDGGFAVGLIFLPLIFLSILAFGSATYIGEEGVAKAEVKVEDEVIDNDMLDNIIKENKENEE